MKTLIRSLLLLCALSASAQEADLLFEKSGPEQAAAGDNVTYVLTVRNLGPDAATDLTLTDTLPGTMTFVSLTHEGGEILSCTTPPIGDPGTVACTTASLAAGAFSTYTLVTNIPASTPDGTSFTNFVSGTTTAADYNDENNTGVASTTVPSQQADVSVIKTGPPNAASDSDVTYTITVSNGGPNDAASVELVDTLPGSMTFVELRQTEGPTFSCSTPAVSASGTITCSIASLAVGASATFELVGHIPDGQTGGTAFQNDAAVSTTTTDINEENNVSSTTLTISEVDVSVTKSGPVTVNAGEHITYTIAIFNAGPDAAFGVTMVDELPANTTFVSLTQTSGPAASCTRPFVGTSGRVECTSGAIASGSTVQFTLVLRAGAEGGDVINTAAIVTTDSFDTDPSNDQSSVTTTVIPAADLAVAKSGPASAVAGENVTYTITVSNAGPSAANTVNLTDTLPPGTTLVSFTQDSGPAFSCTGTSCTIATLAAGGSATFTLVAAVSPSAAGTIENSVTATSDTADGNGANNTATFETTLSASADLAVAKSGPATAASGDEITYTISVTNNGPSDAASVTLNDTLPAGTTLVSLTQNSGPAFSCTGTTCDIATFVAGAAATFTLVIDTPPSASGTAENTATISSPTPDPVAANDSSTVTTTLSASADLAVTKSGPASATPGSTVTYTIGLTNNGPSDASSLTLTDTVPAGTTVVSFNQTSGPVFGCFDNTCLGASLAAGASAAFEITLAIHSGATGTIHNGATVSSSTPDPSSANDTDTASTTLVPSADLGVTKSNPTSITPGTEASYSITVTNAGPSDAANVTVTDTVPAGTTLVSFTQNSGPAFSCAANSCTIASLTSGATATFTVTVAIGSGTTGTIDNTVTVSSTTPDPASANNTAVVSTPLSPSAELAVTKSSPTSSVPGTTATYTITARNGGPSDAINATVTDTVPSNTTLVSFTQTSGPTFSCAGSSCTIASFASGAEAAFVLTVTINPDATGVIENRVTVTSDTADPYTANNTAAVLTPVNISANVGVTKSGPATATPGTNVTYSIAVNNSGPSPAMNVTVTDLLPVDTTPVSLTQTGGPAFTCSDRDCTIASFAPGAVATFLLTLAIDSDATGTMGNSVHVTSDTADPSLANNHDTVLSELTPSADLSVTKTGPAGATAGQTVTYAIGIVNGGPSDAVSVTLSDVLPPNTTFVSFTQNSGPFFTCTTPAPNTNGTITCSAASLVAAANASFTLVIAIDPAASGTLANTATIASTTPDPSAGNNSSTAPTTIGTTADLSVTKTGPATAVAGDTVSYTVTVSNAGPSDAVNVALSDPAPAGTTFVSVVQTDGPAFSCAGTTCTIASLANGATATFTFTYTVDPTTTAPVTNTATVSADTPDPDETNDSDSVTTAPAAGPTDLRISKTASATSATPQSNVTYTIVVTNDGPSTAVDTTVTDVLPAGTTLISSSATQGSCTGTTTVTCSLGELVPSASATITLVVRTPATPGNIANTATVTAANAETDGTDNASTVALAVANPEAIPTLSEWALIGLALLLGLAAARALKM